RESRPAGAGQRRAWLRRGAWWLRPPPGPGRGRWSAGRGVLLRGGGRGAACGPRRRGGATGARGGRFAPRRGGAPRGGGGRRGGRLASVVPVRGILTTPAGPVQ